MTIISEIAPQMEDVTDFVKQSGLKMHVLPVHENPHRPMQDQNKAWHYSCKLINEEGKWFVVYYSKGFGLRTWREPAESTSLVHTPLDKIGQEYDGPMPPWSKDAPAADIETFEKCTVPAIPTITEVINCLAVDCTNVEKSQGNLIAWMQQMKINSDDKSAKGIWKAVLKQRQQLNALLGDGLYHQLIYETEPLK